MSWLSRIAGGANQSQERDALRAFKGLLDHLSADRHGYTQDYSISFGRDTVEIEIHGGMFARTTDVEQKHQGFIELLKADDLQIEYSRSILHLDEHDASETRSEIAIPIEANGGLKELTRKVNSYLRQERLHDDHDQSTWTDKLNARRDDDRELSSTGPSMG